MAGYSAQGYAKSQPVAVEEGSLEPDVLPVFYYNDLLVSGLGERVGLNLFEPRYKEMCRRMTKDPRFLFMPNFQDYCARAGDVGFVIKLTQLRQNPGDTFGIQGFAESFAAVACTWVEPETHGLHMAHFWPMPKTQATLTRTELKALLATMHSSGWAQSGAAARYSLAHAEDEKTQVLLGLNWPDRYWLHSPVLTEGLTRHLTESWIATLPQLTAPRFTSASFVKEAANIVAFPSPGVYLQEVCDSIRKMIRQDSEAVALLRGLPQRKDQPDPDAISEDLWKKLLSEVRICLVFGLAAAMSSIRVELLRGVPAKLQSVMEDCFPWRQEEGASSEAQVAVLANEGNVYFLAPLEEVEVTKDSAAQAIKQLSWMLNRLRLKVVHRGRAAGHGPLAMLEDDVCRLISDFVAPSPSEQK